jgi:deoxyribose-phosphate aldolase
MWKDDAVNGDLVDRIVRDVLAQREERTGRQKVRDTDEGARGLSGHGTAHPPQAPAAYNPDRAMACGADRVSCTLGLLDRVRGEIARMIDHTLLKPEATRGDVERLCKEARENKFASVCVNPCWVPLCARLLDGSLVKVCTVIGFPLGATTSKAKAAETRQAVRDGAQEVDMVLNIGWAKDGEWRQVEEDVRSVVDAAGNRVLKKVILETCLLTDEQIVKACVACRAAGADFVKTSTGFSSGGATAEHVALMRRVVGAGMGVKASGGVRTLNDAVQLIESGADRLGASASVAIVGGKSPAAGGSY